MDAFYAAVEQRDRPELRGKPVIIGGPSMRSVVSTASYEARPFGVRSAMSMVEAMRRCPQGIIVPPRHSLYAEVSGQIFAIFRRYTPLVEGLSLDEAFLDVTASRSLYGSGEEIAARVKEAIRTETGLTASVGVAPSKFIAKVASDLQKPDGLVIVRPGDERAFLEPLPIERMWGLGKKSAPIARSAGFHTLGDLARADLARLERTFGQQGAYYAALARGEDDREVESSRDALSIGAEETFETDLRRREELEERLLSQAMRVASRLMAEGLVAWSVTVKIKYADFTLRTRAITLDEPVCDTDSIYTAAKELLTRFELGKKGVRLTGIQAHKFEARGAKTTLFPDEKIERGTKLETATQALKAKFGDATITRAALLDRPSRDRSGR